MKKHFRLILTILLIPITIFGIYILVVLIQNSIYDYRPQSGPANYFPKCEGEPLTAKQSYSIISWNIGYGGLGKDADFFFDGGKMVRPEKDIYDGYWSGIMDVAGTFDSIDFILFQEVDTASFRSFSINQFRLLEGALPSKQGVYIKNYDARYVPVPLFSPMRAVVSGLSTFSGYQIDRARMGAFPGNYPWPKSLFMPDRCFLHISHSLPSGKKLHVINTHNSAFDDGFLRKAQLEYLFAYMDSLYLDGDYVVAGGDWNVNPPAYTGLRFLSHDTAFRINISIPVFEDYATWTVCFDPDYPTNRDVSSAYKAGQTPVTILDFYICSPNIKELEIKTFHSEFKYSDHQAVYLRFALH